jgi:hypothetical protein
MYSTSQRHTFVLTAERLVLPDKFIALHLHILHLIVVLGECAIELGLEHGGLLPGLGEFFLQSLDSEHRVVEPLEHLGFLPGPPHHPAERQQLLEYLFLLELDYSRVQSCTFIHCSARRIASKLRATVAGSTRSSIRSSSPPRLVAAVSDIGAERIGSAS